MNRVARLIPIIALALLFTAIYSGRAHTAPANTVVCSSITSNTTWTTALSPYEICNTTPIAVQSGVTLTIQPGVTVIFDGSAYQFTVQGTLNSLGTTTQPITITAATATPGSWRGILVAGTSGVKATLNLDHTTVQYGGKFTTAEIYADQAAISINHSQIQSSINNGLELTNNVTFTVQNTSFTNNAQDAMTVHEPKTDLAMTGLTATGNGANAVHVAGLTSTMTGQRRWTNPGIPYLVDVAVSNNSGDVLTIDPGVVMNFSNSGRISIGGELLAQGTQTEPITMTSLTKTPGDWVGIYGNGGTAQADIQLDYVTVEYGGRDINGANVEVTDGRLIAHHSIIRHSSKDGVKIDANAVGSVIDSQIYANGSYGVEIPVLNHGVLASNNWWGAASGPHPDNPACGAGTGDKVSTGVLFLPFATGPNAIQAFPLTSAPAITMTPRRFYAPADGVTRIYFDITLRDGNGNPISGRQVNLTTTFGTPTSGGITDLNGKTLAFLTSTTAGNAAATASLIPSTACEAAVSPESDVTFTTPINITDLMPDGEAPYFNGNLSLSPLPVIVGITTTISARLTNPLTTSVTVDVEFSFVQSGIGLAFGPIKTITGQVIPANSTVTDTAQFIPPFSGHYCVQVAYTIIPPVGAASVKVPAATKQLKPFNFNAQQSTTSGGGKNADLSKTRNSLKAVNRFVGRAYDNTVVVPLAVANAGIEWDLNNAEKISNALNGDPPRQDYTLISTPVLLQLPPTQAGGGITQARADALNALDSAMAQANAYGTAAAIAFDRAGGAAAAGDLNWESTQTGVMLQYNQQFGQALITAAQKIDALLQEAAGEGVTSLMISASDVITMQAQLASGFTAPEIADAHALGLSDTDIEAIRQSIITARPEDLAGDVITNMKQISASFYELGAVLSNPTAFAPGLTVAGGATPLQPQTTNSNTMVQIYDTTSSFQVGNTTGVTATINLTARRIDLPADWSVQVTPAQITLAPGGQITATVTILAGSPLPQGSRPMVAVEGSIGSQLIGGVVVEVLAPIYRPWDGKLKFYLPSVMR